jgi:hypothetical protein
VIEGAEIIYRDSNTGRRRSNSIRLCGRCVDRYDQSEAGKKLRNIILAVIGLGAVLLLAGYTLMHR